MNLITIALTAASIFGGSNTDVKSPNIYDYSVKDINKKDVKLSDYKGKYY